MGMMATPSMGVALGSTLGHSSRQVMTRFTVKFPCCAAGDDKVVGDVLVWCGQEVSSLSYQACSSARDDVSLLLTSCLGEVV